jgi:soluble lytic murein transglycosylase-like protein
MALAARTQGVPLLVLYAVGLTETGEGGRLAPYAMNIDGRATRPSSLPEALRVFEAARAAGARMIDVGCMQIDWRWHAREFASPAAMFDPAANVRYAARFLAQLRARESSWTLAVARYNAGPANDPAQRKYVCAVIEKLVASGAGNWTPAARTFCGAAGAGPSP